MDLSDPVNLAEDLLERVAQGNLTFTKSEVKKIAAMLDKLAWRVGDAYQVAAALADFARMKDDPAVIRALDFLADPMRPGMIMPAYIEIGNAGVPALTMMRMDLDRAARALAEGDVTAMMAACKSLSEYEL